MTEMSFRLLLPLLLAVLATGCESARQCPPYCESDEEVLARAGAVRLEPAQVRAQVSGKTEEWIHGGAYYRADGGLEIKWRKVRYKATWDVSDRGEICYQLPKWPRRCHFYMKLDGEILMLDEGRNQGARRYYEGNRLSRLGHRVPILQGEE